MPALLKMIDPETLKEIQETQGEMHSKMAVRFLPSLLQPIFSLKSYESQAFQNLDTSSVSKFLAPVAAAEPEKPILLLPQAKGAARKRR